MPVKRGKRKIKADYSLKDLYKFYKKNYNSNLTYKQFKQVLTESVSYIMNRILNDSEEFILPNRLGNLRVKRFKNRLILDENNKVNMNFLKVDYKSSWEYWRKIYKGLSDEEIGKIPDKKHIYHLNEHTNGYYNRIYWDKTSMNIRNQHLYSFTPVRSWKEMLATLSNQNKIYYE